jgi:hypothetical protein
MLMKPLFPELVCEIENCGGTMTKISETEAVCTNDERHRRVIRKGPKAGLRELINCGMLKDYPGHWHMTGMVEGDSREWAVLRKPDGTYWQVVGTDWGVRFRISIGDQIVDKKEIAFCQSQYVAWREKNALLAE